MNFRPLPDEKYATVEMIVDGKTIKAREGQSVASALLCAGGDIPYRTSAYTGAPRAPYCMMGACFECLVIIDGRANCQGCLTPVRQGMVVSRQFGKRVVSI